MLLLETVPSFIRKRSELLNIYMLCTLYFSYRYAINIKLWSLCALLSQIYVTSRIQLKVIMRLLCIINFIYYSEHEDYEIGKGDKERGEGDKERGVKPKRRQKRGQSRGGRGRGEQVRRGQGRGARGRRG